MLRFILGMLFVIKRLSKHVFLIFKCEIRFIRLKFKIIDLNDVSQIKAYNQSEALFF